VKQVPVGPTKTNENESPFWAFSLYIKKNEEDQRPEARITPLPHRMFYGRQKVFSDTN
jgi:hypothetical protein